MNIPKPADSTWTDGQWNAIVSTGQDILLVICPCAVCRFRNVHCHPPPFLSTQVLSCPFQPLMGDTRFLPVIHQIGILI